MTVGGYVMAMTHVKLFVREFFVNLSEFFLCHFALSDAGEGFEGDLQHCPIFGVVLGLAKVKEFVVHAAQVFVAGHECGSFISVLETMAFGEGV